MLLHVFKSFLVSASAENEISHMDTPLSAFKTTNQSLLAVKLLRPESGSQGQGKSVDDGVWC
jgi:hypothetical protein